VRTLPTLILSVIAASLIGSAGAAQTDVASEADPDGMSVTIKPKQTPEQKTDKKNTAAKNKKGKVETKTAEKPSKRDAETSLRYLNNGNTRFSKKNFRSDGRTPADREKGLDGENPHSAILASSDSRVVPEIIFDQGLGELYTVRTLGEGIDDAVIASLEYSVDKLKVPLIVVLGNSDCAVMKFHSLEDSSALSDPMKDLVDATEPRLKTLKRESPSPSYEVEATLNADAIARELVRKSTIIKTAVESGQLKVKSALYRINTGRVTFY
jgi:carbonic anhydrase